MNTYARVAIIGIGLLMSHCLFAADVVQIKADALFERAKKMDESFVILDVRTPEEYAQGHVPGAINIPHDKLANRIGELLKAKNKDVVVYCGSGKRAGMAAETLKANGFVKLLHLEGDMQGWMTSKRPIEK